MKGHGTKFDRKKEDAIVALLTHRTMDEAARSVGIGTNTLLRWMEEPEFKTAFLEARRSAFSQAIARMQHASGTAVSVLLKTMIDPATPASTRVRAADSVLNHAAKAIELEDIEVRLCELERAAKLDRV
jgi:hypothetical protein